MGFKEIDDSKIIRKKLEESRTSPFRTYMHLNVGEGALTRFILYEFLTCLLSPMPGGIGFFLRKLFYPMLFKTVGKGFIIGRNTVIRHPDKIHIGNNVTIDDNCVIDARGAGKAGIVIEDNVILNRNCLVLAKAGSIHIGKRSSIGSNSVIVSMDGVEIGKAVLTAGGVTISAGTYHFENINFAVMDQGAYTKGPIKIDDNAWLGTGVVVLDGVSIGSGAVVGACSLVNKDIPMNSIAFGIPVKVQRYKGENREA
jgi:acetyltransferase-like isoleucine patch superfamily enzyme